jgi:hypothetical protein
MTTNKRVQYAAAAAAAIAVAFGAYVAGDNGSTQAASATTTGAASRQSGQLPPGAQVAPNAQPPSGGQAPPGFGTPVTGAAADKVAAAALDEYDGTVERVMRLTDGSYVVHVITSNGEIHVLVSKTYAVTGVEQDRFPGPGGPNGAPSPDDSQEALPSAGGTQS